ncbi:MAG TPA: hypothetical protein DCP63_10525 [Bacteroidetes bacterium]|nr:hypothetical protein [Bacteroidota bacterium]
MRVRTLIIVVLLLLTATQLSAGDRSNVRAMGMGRTLVAGSRGIEAIGINPANLAAAGNSAFSLGLAPAGLRVSTELFSYDIYQSYFTGEPGTTAGGSRKPKYLTDADKNDILSSLPDGLAETRFDVEAMPLGFTISAGRLGGLGAAVIEHAGALLELPKDYFRFFLFGLDSAGSRYVLDGTAASAWWWREYNISYGIRLRRDTVGIRELSIGVGVKLLRGYAMMETDHYTGSFGNSRIGSNQYQLNAQFDYLTRRSGVDFLDEEKNEDFGPFPDPAGKGTGFDFGINAQVRPGLFVAASVTDIGKMEWSENVVQTEGRYKLVIDDPFKEENTDSLERAVRGTNSPGKAFSVSLPTTLRVGVAINSSEFTGLKFLPGRMLIALDYSQGLNKSMGNTTEPRVALGMEYRLIPLLPLRTGIAFGGGDVPRWSAGFGLDLYYLSLDVGTENFGVLFSPKNFQMFSFAAGLRLRF